MQPEKKTEIFGTVLMQCLRLKNLVQLQKNLLDVSSVIKVCKTKDRKNDVMNTKVQLFAYRSKFMKTI